MRLWDKISLIALVVLAIIGKLTDDSGNDQRRPDPRQYEPPVAQAPPGSRPIPGDFRNAPTFIVEIEKTQQSSTGTAFSVGENGIWITARHVTDGCDVVVVRTAHKKGMSAQRVIQESNADISVLRTRTGAPSLPVTKPTLRNGEKGWSFGYPKGDPGDVYGQVIGRAKMRAQGRYSSLEPVIAWTHLRRVPDRGADLGGISGGPWVDAGGRVVGVHVAGAPRRGRSYSTAPSTLLAALSRAGVNPSDRTVIQLSAGNFAQIGDLMRERLTIAKVYCLVGEKWRKRRGGPGW